MKSNGRAKQQYVIIITLAQSVVCFVDKFLLLVYYGLLDFVKLGTCIMIIYLTVNESKKCVFIVTRLTIPIFLLF